MQLEKNAVLVNARTGSKWAFIIVQQVTCYRFDRVLIHNSSYTARTDCHPVSDVEFFLYRFREKVVR